MRIALYGNTLQAAKSVYVEDVLRTLECLGVEVCVEEKFAAFLKSIIVDKALRAHQYNTFRFDECEADIALSVGGDGTFLNTAAKVGAAEIPILGINTGRLGFLADVMPNAIASTLQAVVRGEYVVEDHSVIFSEKDGTPFNIYPYALNEVAILKHDNSALIEVVTWVNGELLANYLADGLIVCTPTGSTGYSLSVGGPVIVPQSHTFCISAVAPHSLTARPVVLCDDVVIEVEVRSRSEKFLVAIDGRSESLNDKVTIRMRRANYDVKVMKVNYRHFFDSLRSKMMWGMDQRF